MAEETKVTLEPISVDRNGVKGEFVEHLISRGEKKNTPYHAPVINESNVETWVNWIGKQASAGILQSFMKRVSQGWADEATDETTGEFSPVKFATLAASFSVVGESKKVLEERLRELQLELQRVDVVKIMALPQDAPERKSFIELAQRIQSVSTAIEQKRRDRKAEDEEPVSSV